MDECMTTISTTSMKVPTYYNRFQSILRLSYIQEETKIVTKIVFLPGKLSNSSRRNPKVHRYFQVVSRVTSLVAK